MKKKFTLEIAKPCSENFDKMVPNSKGSFCDSCMKTVIDLSKKSNSEVAKFIAENKDQNICARLKTSQLEEEFVYNETSKLNNLKYAAVAATILLASNLTAQEKEPVKTEKACTEPMYRLGKVVSNQTVNEEVLVTVKGKLLEEKTNKPFDNKIYPDLVLSINGSQSIIKLNPKTGEFSIPVKVLSASKTLTISITANDYYLSKTIDFDIKSVKNNVLQQNIIINADELSRIEPLMMGGLGINYSNK
ncbi:hypothetical protein [Flavobacterium sp.]|uniref:hypothetical protein n=1 Tax=Flavobacterium sp. TaxID=239 RepID=UPI0031E0C314